MNRSSKMTMGTSSKFMLGSLIIAASTFVYTAIAAPPATPYNLGETLAPTCSPGDSNCTVDTPQEGNAYLTDIAGITASQGDIIYFNSTDWVNLGPGTSGDYLQTQGAGANPQWASAGVGDITAVGSMISGAAFADATATGDWLGLGSAAGRIEFDDQATDEVNILDANVGIGTTSPSRRVHIVSTSSGNFEPALVLENTGGGNTPTSTGILFTGRGNGLFKGGIAFEDSSGSSYGRGNLYFLNNNTADSSEANISDAKMTITNDGNVGIGTTSPGYALDVVGDINVTGSYIKGYGHARFNQSISAIGTLNIDTANIVEDGVIVDVDATANTFTLTGGKTYLVSYGMTGYNFTTGGFFKIQLTLSSDTTPLGPALDVRAPDSAAPILTNATAILTPSGNSTYRLYVSEVSGTTAVQNINSYVTITEL